MLDKLVALLVTFTILMMTVIGGPASVCMMAREHEKKTFLTTLLLPIRSTDCSCREIFHRGCHLHRRGSIQSVCLGLFVVFLFGSMLGHSFSLTQVISDFQHLTITTGSYYLTMGAIMVHRIRQMIQIPTLPEVLLMVAFFCSTGALLSAIYLCVAGYGKTIKSAQMLVSLPMIFLMALPTIAMIPGIQFNIKTALIPIANLLIMRKFDNPAMLPAAIAILEPWLIVVLILFFVRRNFETQVEGGRKKKSETVKTA
ncbi:MAG: hypothetical protein U0103_10725 [Candidatus Obscuribacterales bacterium]